MAINNKDFYDELATNFTETISGNGDTIQWQTKFLNELAKHDVRYNSPAVKSEFNIASSSNPLSISRLMRMVDGVMFTHQRELEGQSIPFRLLTDNELKHIEIEVQQELEKNPLLDKIPGMYKRLYMTKKLSQATSVFIPNGEKKEAFKKDKNLRFFTEEDIGNLPHVVFNNMDRIYSSIEQEYNTHPDDIDDNTLRNFLSDVLDKKKVSHEKAKELLTGLSLFAAQKTLIAFYQMLMQLMDNIQLGASLENSTILSTKEYSEN